MTAPVIGGLDQVVFDESGARVDIGSTITFNGGLGYPGGSITFSVSNSTSDDMLRLSSEADADLSGAISVDVDGKVYLGNGTGHDLIGLVDETQNGQNGQALTIHFTSTSTGALSNPGFETGTGGWTIGQQRVILGQDSINGWRTPDDVTDPPRAGDDAGSIQEMTYSSEVATDQHSEGTHSLRLFNDGQTGAGFDVVHGPYAYSETFHSQAGDVLNFDWRAAAGQDAFDAFGYLMNAATGQAITVLDQTGANDSGETNWATSSVVVPSEGDWFFVFVAGTYDFTGGQAVGGSLYIDNFTVVKSKVTDQVLEAIAKQIQYEHEGDAAVEDRSLTVEVKDGAGHPGTGSADLQVVNIDDPFTGAVAVAGTAAQGQVLAASNTIADPDGLGAITYHWQRETTPGVWTDINGATGANYTLTETDVGHAVRAIADFTDNGGTPGQVTSDPTTAVANVNDAPGGSVQAVGQARQDQTLTALNTITDPDGVGTVSYHWQRETAPGVWTNINGATGGSYTLTQDDVGHKVRAVADYTDGHGTPEQVLGNATASVNDAPSGTVAVAGSAAQGQVLTASNDLVDTDGMGGVSYRWQREVSPGVWGDIDNATGATYTLTQGDVDHRVRVVASYTDGQGVAEQVAATPVTAVANTNDAPGGNVTVSGVVSQGATLTATSNLTDADGMGTISYHWERETSPGVWTDIDGATGAHYTLVQDDVGHAVRAVASYTDGYGAAEHVDSAASTAVGNVGFTHDGSVQLAGTATQGEVLTASNDMTDVDGMGPVTYQWQREAAPGVWEDIDGATGATYTLTEADVGHGVRAVGSYTDGDGTPENEASDPTVAVVNVNDAPAGVFTADGIATQGQVLTASNTIADADGLGTISYQWQRQDADGNWHDIDGATDAAYTLTQDDVGHAVRTVASYTDGHGAAEHVESVPTAAVTNVDDAFEGTVLVTGLASQGAVLTASNDLTDLDGPNPLVVTYQWQREDEPGHWVDIAGATEATYALTQDDVDHLVRAVAHYVDAFGAAGTAPSEPTLAVANVNDAPVTADDSFPAVAADGSAVTIDVLQNDSDLDGDVTHITQIDGHAIATGGSVEVAGGLVTLDSDGRLLFTPSITFDGTAHFTYTADDGHGGTDTGMVSGTVTAAAPWGDFGEQLEAILGDAGTVAPSYINELLYIASVVAPGAFNTGDNGLGAGYHAGLGYGLTPDLATPDADLLARTLQALLHAADSDAPSLLTDLGPDGWGSAIDQNLLFQSNLGVAGNVQIDYANGGDDFMGQASQGWSKQFALQALNPNMSEEMFSQFDGRSQGQLHQADVGQGAHISVNIGGEAAGTPQAALSNAFGMVDFVTAAGNSAVEVARPMAIAETGGADDQTATVRMRQGGTLDLHVEFYKVDDFTGAIGNLRPGDAGYAAAADARAYHTDTGDTWLAGGGFGKYSEGTLVGIDDGDLIAMRLTNGKDQFFAFAQANETEAGQHVGHLWSYGLNTWGWEDMAGGGDRDFNDLVVQLDFSSHSPIG
ncbi:MAG TPA: Ig-like domain-containing protein [Roseomonas sp.]